MSTHDAQNSTAARLGRLILKELREILRDRRTILTLLLMPVLVYPLLAIAFGQFSAASQASRQASIHQLGFVDDTQVRLFEKFLRRFRGQTASRPGTTDSPEPELPTAIDADLDEAVSHGKFDLGVRLIDPERWQEALAQPFPVEGGLALNCELLYVPGNPHGEQALDHVEGLLRSCNNAYLALRLRAANVEDQRADPVRFHPVPQADTAPSSFSLKSFIPLVLILMTITGAVYPAIDLTAGERERGTLEILVAAPVPRLGLLFAKYVAVVAVALLTALTNLVMMTVTTLSFPGVGEMAFGPAGLTVTLVLEVSGVLLLFAVFFSALLLVLTSFARSFKEAQAYIVPLMLLTLAPGVLALLPEIRLGGLLSVAPLMNMVLLARDLFEGRGNLTTSLVVVVSTLFYAVAALSLAARLFGDEAVLYSEQSGWADLFRRPREERNEGSVVSALVCMALMFPAIFYASALLPRPDPRTSSETATRMIIQSAGISTVVFLGFPFVAAYMRRVRAREGFQLRVPPLVAVVGAALLGLCLWPLIVEIWLGMGALGLRAPERPFRSRDLQQLIQRWQEVAPWLLIIAYGLLAPVVEEWFFRGYLFTALRATSGKWLTIGLSGLLFGLFHFVAVNMMAAERFVTTTCLGLILGWIAWETGSVYPGMVLHVLNNTVLLLLARRPDWAESLWGWNPNSQAHLPVWWIAVALVGSATGFALVWISRPSAARLDALKGQASGEVAP